MTLTAPKLRINPENLSPYKDWTGVSANDYGDYAYDWFGNDNPAAGGPPTVSTSIAGYYDDGTNHTVYVDFPYVTDRTQVLAGAGFSFVGGIPNYDANLSNITFLQTIYSSAGSDGVNIGSQNQFGLNYIINFMWMTKSWCQNYLYTQKSTNLTTKLQLWYNATVYSKQTVYMVALNGPNQGAITTLITGAWSGTNNPNTGQNYFTFYLPSHPSGGPDKVYYGLVSANGGYYNVVYPYIAGGTSAWGALALQVDADTLLPPQV